MDYSPKGLSHACEVEKTFTEFFHAVKAALRSADEKSPQKWEEAEKTLAEALYQVTKRKNEVGGAAQVKENKKEEGKNGEKGGKKEGERDID